MEQPMNRNGSGYIDLTAFEAMKNVMKGKGKGMRTGEIWEVECGRYTNLAIVIADHDRYCSILKLNESGYEDDIEINCQGIKYCDCGMISYSFNDKMIGFVRTLKDEEFAYVMESVADNLGISSKVIEKEVPVEVVKEITKEVPVGSGNVEEIARLKAEAEIYKGMYEQLLQTMLKGGSNG